MEYQVNEIADRLKSLIEEKGLTRYKLAKLTKVPYTTLIKIMDGTTKNPQIETLNAIADYFGVSVDYLTGNSVRSLIEFESEMAGLTLDDLANKAGVRKDFILNIDDIMPDSDDYAAVERIANALKMKPATLRSALARQEPPAYDGPVLTPEEAFADTEEEFENEDLDETIAAHHDGEDWTEEELEEIKRFKEFVKMKRGHRTGE
ncbi:helix-turn-helix transcriptional regulator [Paenibacillus sp. HN-1]|nr:MULTISPECIES: helix-turn-helix transcriptional regulator [Paenibacillus]MBY9078267.1 helix-turn-helix transcriptional regulator [Paenibacillus sp. CGMCC 1.18879]MBY9086074.1 helix-turn-helix transcriptional regulator [Paenibacillus sinensis]